MRRPGKPDFRLIDQFTLAGLKADRESELRLRRFHWRYHAELAEQRSRAAAELSKALIEAAVESHSFKNWQRAVRARWFLKPLSSRGSLTFPGGRFNVGEIEPGIASFPALYLAADKRTAMSEVLGQPDEPGAPLAGIELALSKPDSIAFYSVSGCCETLIDLTQPERLQPFVDLIKEFEVSSDLKKLARELFQKPGSPPVKLVLTTVKEIVESLTFDQWREWPVQLGIPSNPQIFGQLLLQAGIGGVLYPSRFGSVPCLALLPQNFSRSTSFVELDEEPARKDVVRRLDRHTWEKLTR